jgi:hypothetical protein
MPTAIVTPAQLRVFARQLGDSADRISRRRKKVATQVKDARAVWKDEKYATFFKTFDETVKQLDLFARRALEYAAFLEAKARLADRYLNNK